MLTWGPQTVVDRLYPAGSECVGSLTLSLSAFLTAPHCVVRAKHDGMAIPEHNATHTKGTLERE
jgi:hypothetical protein